MRYIDTYEYEGKISLATLLLTAGVCFSLPYFAWKWLYKNFAGLSLLLHILNFATLFKLISVSIGLLSWSIALRVQECLAALASLKLVYSHLGEVA